MKFFIVDAFTDTIFGGNPAGVVLLRDGEDFPKDEVMIKTAAELRYSETAFIKPLGPSEFNIRYFTPVAEVDLCGHATIASFHVLVNIGKISPNSHCVNHTLAGDLNITITDGSIMMNMAPPVEISTMDNIAEINELYNIMGIVYNNDKINKLYPRLISTGLPDIIMPVGSREELDRINPDMKRLAAFSKKMNVTGVHVFTLDQPDDGVIAHCRDFAPLYDIDEEAATGTANGALTYYLYINNIIQNGAKCKIIQGEKMGRPSVILTEIHADDNKCMINVGGKAVIVADGNINI